MPQQPAPEGAAPQGAAPDGSETEAAAPQGSAPQGSAPIALRPYAPGDAAEIVTWFADLDELRLFVGFAAAWPLTAGDLDSFAARPDVRSFTVTVPGGGVAEAAGTSGHADVAGHVDLVEEGAGVWRLARIAIAPRLRGRRLASPLVEAALDEARAHGARTVALHVVPGNEPALRTYRRLGFAATEPHPKHPGYLRMVLDLAGVPGRSDEGTAD